MLESLKSVSFKETENGYDLIPVGYNGSWNIYQHESTDGKDYSLALHDIIYSVAYDSLECAYEDGELDDECIALYENDEIPSEYWDLGVEALMDALEENGAKCLVS